MAVLVGLLAASQAVAKPASDDPDYPHGEFGGDCSLCHGPSGWTPLRLPDDFDHANFGMKLEGSHHDLDCTACHTTLDFTQSPEPRCASCHEDIHHGENGLDCAACHDSRTFRSFQEMTRDHQLTRFPLTGAHRAIDCADCHSAARGNLVFTISVECVSCHRPVYQAAKNPDHVNGGFPDTCESCHTTVVWQQASFDHDLTGFPLRGAHRATACESCHSTGVYAGTSAQCVSCHRADYDATVNPNHAQAGFPTDCATCHTATTWTGAAFDHNLTSFPLNGAHQAVTCESCHASGVYAGTPSQCVSCHRTDYDTTVDPNHAQAGFGTDCTTCHTTTTWTGAAFDHGLTSFPLTGAHLAVNCESCHASGIYAGTPSQCVSCHRTDYDTTVDPNHAQSGFGTDCTTCHTTTTWVGGAFDHTLTSFPLTGAHRAVTCDACHGDGVFAGKSTACFSCHATDYQTTVDPDHAQAGFSVDCQVCHTTSTWTGATFDHDLTNFPLTGSHRAVVCQDCHGDGVYAGRSTACASCHQVDYEQTTDPNHRASGFSTTCESCHDTTTWSNATFDHDGSFFPIYSGKHNGRWQACSDCHVDPNNYSVFECIFCHAHSDRNHVDDQHSGRSGYVYESQACYACHPRGNA